MWCAQPDTAADIFDSTGRNGFDTIRLNFSYANMYHQVKTRAFKFSGTPKAIATAIAAARKAHVWEEPQ